MDLSQPTEWAYPIPTYYGPGRLSDLGALCASHGVSRPLVVTDKASRDLPFMADLAKSLRGAGLPVEVFSDVSPNPKDHEIETGRQRYRHGRHDGVVGIGGGSGMDGAKAICLTALNDVPVLDFNYLQPPPVVTGDHPFPTLITIPTTAGTGAETEATAMITDTTRNMKWCLAHPESRVCATILDPEVTIGLPRHLTAWTGFDALVHAIEAYCVPGFYPLYDGAALEALRLISANLEPAHDTPRDMNARGGMLVGSYLAGIAFLKGLGLVHAISHMVGAEYDTHHGLTNAVVLPSVLKFNADTIGDKIAPMSQAMSLPSTDFQGFYDCIRLSLDRLDVPRSLVDIGVPETCAREIAAKAMEDGAYETNPRRASLDELVDLLQSSLTRGR